jgi:hypothetical protein
MDARTREALSRIVRWAIAHGYSKRSLVDVLVSNQGTITMNTPSNCEDLKIARRALGISEGERK